MSARVPKKSVEGWVIWSNSTSGPYANRFDCPIVIGRDVHIDGDDFVLPAEMLVSVRKTIEPHRVP